MQAGRQLDRLQHVSKSKVDSWTEARLPVDELVSPNSPSGQAKQQKSVRCRMFNLIAEIEFDSRALPPIPLPQKNNEGKRQNRSEGGLAGVGQPTEVLLCARWRRRAA